MNITSIPARENPTDGAGRAASVPMAHTSMSAHNKTERPLAYYRTRLAALDKDTIQARTGLSFDVASQSFALRYLSRDVLISYPSGYVSYAHEEASLSPAAEILLLRVLVEGNLVPSSGAFLPYAEVGWGESYFKAFEGRCLKRFARMFETAADFARAAPLIGGVAAAAGDASFDFEVVNGVYMRLIFWEGDDEFAARAQILFSDNTPLTFTSEDAAVMGDLLLNELSAASKKLKNSS